MPGQYDDDFETMAQMMEQSDKSPTDAGSTSHGRRSHSNTTLRIPFVILHTEYTK